MVCVMEDKQEALVALVHSGPDQRPDHSLGAKVIKLKILQSGPSVRCWFTFTPQGPDTWPLEPQHLEARRLF